MKDNYWYKKLLAYSLIIGFVGGTTALLFSSLTGWGSDLLFSSDSTEAWSGSIWWIPTTSFGAILVTFLRDKLSVAKKVPGAVELAKESWVDPATAVPLILVATLSIIFGASLGPSFGIVMLGGAFASWLVTKIGPKFTRDQQKEFARTGMTGGLGAVFGAPILATILTIELSPSKIPYIMSVIPRLLASSLGYLVFFGVTGAVIIDAYSLPTYTYRNIDMIIAAVLGLIAVGFLLIFTLISKITGVIMDKLKNNYVKALIGGAAVGFISYALPVTFGSGNSQLAEVTAEYSLYGAGLIVVVLVAKTVAIKISQESGFIGGNIFPILFYSGLCGLLIHSIFLNIPVGLAVGAMMATIPGAALAAPISLILIAVSGLSQQTAIIPPLTIAVTITQICMYLFTASRVKKVAA